MPRGYVAELGDEALSWARAHADRVSVRVGNTHFSAGAAPIGHLPEWPGPEPRARHHAEADEPRPWRIEARTGWYRPDIAEVAARLVEALTSDPTTSDTTHTVGERWFSVSFTVVCPSLLGAKEASFEVLRGAWASTQVVATPGIDYDVSSVQVWPAMGERLAE